MPRRVLSESGFYHITVRAAGQIALFEDDDDRRRYLRLLKRERDKTGARIIAWVLMTDHVHLVVDFGQSRQSISAFMHNINWRYTSYFNEKTGRFGTLFQGRFWSKPISDDAQLVATVHYIHMNPERAGLSSMRLYRWSSYQEYAGKHWVVDTALILDWFGCFDAFDAYEGSPKDVVRKPRCRPELLQDEGALRYACELANVNTSAELRSMATNERNELVHRLSEEGVSNRRIARTLGIGATTVSRILRS